MFRAIDIHWGIHLLFAGVFAQSFTLLPHGVGGVRELAVSKFRSERCRD